MFMSLIPLNNSSLAHYFGLLWGNFYHRLMCDTILMKANLLNCYESYIR